MTQEEHKRNGQIKKGKFTTFDKMPLEMARALQSKGGSVSSPRKQWAAYLREMKKAKRLSDTQANEIGRAMMDPKCSILQMQEIVRKHFLGDGETDLKKIKIGMDYLERVHKLLHGEKTVTENVHHIINWGDILSNCEVDEEDENRPKEASVTDIQD